MTDSRSSDVRPPLAAPLPPATVLNYARPAELSGLTPGELLAQVPRFRHSRFSSRLLLVALACYLGSVGAAFFSAKADGRGSDKGLVVVGIIAMIVLMVVGGVSILSVCAIVLTGHVYLPTVGQDGRLKTWGIANKVAAALFLAGGCALLFFAASLLRI